MTVKDEHGATHERGVHPTHTASDLAALISEVHRRSTGDTDLERLAAAVTVSGELTRQADAAVGHFVEAARRAGCSWARIGSVLGVTRQAAQQQDSHRRARPGWRLPRARRSHDVVGSDFAGPNTERMRSVLALAGGEATRLHHDWIGTEHLLLGLLSENEGVVSQALGEVGVTLHAARWRVEQIVGSGPVDAKAPGRDPWPYTPRARRALELAQREARKLGHTDVGAEHTLLGLLAEGRGVAAEALVELGVDLPGLRRRVIDRLGADTSNVPPARP